MTESSLHRALKTYYAAAPEAATEVNVDGYLIDVVRGDGGLVEIQTGNFGALKPKLAALLPAHRLTLVYPIAVEKWLVKLPAEGDEPLERRRSPRRGRLAHVFTELVRIPDWLTHPHLRLEALLIQTEELRRDDGRGSWRRKGWSIVDQRLLAVLDRVALERPADFARFLPPSLPPSFTSHDLSKALGVRRNLAQRALYCLRCWELVEIESRGRRGYRYHITFEG